MKTKFANIKIWYMSKTKITNTEINTVLEIRSQLS